MGRSMRDLPGVHFNLGRAAVAVASARAACLAGCAEVDARIDAGVIPTEDDYLRQMALAADALARADVADSHLRKVLGGNGLREGHRTYLINSRGDEAMGSTWAYLDVTALGRQEAWEDSPAGYPQTPPYRWWNYHDAYSKQA